MVRALQFVLVVATSFWTLSLLSTPLLVQAQRRTTTTTTTPSINSTTTTTKKPTKFLVTDPSCQHTEDNIWEVEDNSARLDTVSLYVKKDRFPSYVGYPCNVTLYKRYQNRFFDRYMACPFEKGLDDNFRTFVKNDLWNLKQRDDLNINIENSSLVYQYICFSQNIEQCVFDAERSRLKGACSGVCKCMPEITPMIRPAHLKKPPFTNKSRPFQVLENNVRCGIQAGGACVFVWGKSCTNLTSDPELENKYKPRDLDLQCEINAGCHPVNHTCMCAVGHKCVGDLGVRTGGSWSLYNVLGMMVLAWMYK